MEPKFGPRDCSISNWKTRDVETRLEFQTKPSRCANPGGSWISDRLRFHCCRRADRQQRKARQHYRHRLYGRPSKVRHHRLTLELVAKQKIFREIVMVGESCRRASSRTDRNSGTYKIESGGCKIDRSMHSPDCHNHSKRRSCEYQTQYNFTKFRLHDKNIEGGG